MKRVAIIGAGLGGLSAGALLAKDGYDVTVLERHYMVGGCATVFKRKGGFLCEVGLHEMDGLYTDKTKNEIFTKLGVYENITFVKPDEFFRVKTHHVDFTMLDNIEDAKTKLKKHYPDAKDAIERYFELIKTIYEQYERLQNLKWLDILLFPFRFSKILKYKSKSVKEVLDAIFSNEELKVILNANMGYYHDKASELSFLLHALAQHSYYQGQGWFIKGGSKVLSDYLASLIKENGGEILLRANVTKIEKNRLRYIKNNQEHTLDFDILISNISPEHTYKMAGINGDQNKQIANSLMTLYIGFKKNLKSVYGKMPYSTFLLKNVKTLEDFDKYANIDAKERGFVFVDYSQIDSNLTKDEKKSFGVICTNYYMQN